MELKELTDKMIDLLGIKNINEMSERLFEVVTQNDNEIYDKFCKLVENDLTVDWLQMIYQYYQADRKEKKQDYTPKSLAKLMGMLIGEDSEIIIDLCAGSGALTIQRWNMKQDQHFELHEFDERVIPFLLFNMAVRNITCKVYHADVLQNELYHMYSVKKGDRYGNVKEVI